MADRLTAEQLDQIAEGHCPNCGYRGFVLGPRGGASMNIECGSLDCRARFNIAQYRHGLRLTIGERIARQSEGGSEWTLRVQFGHRGTFS
jgi:hypothetical protein